MRPAAALPMALPEAAGSYWLQQQAINAAAVGVAVRAWQNSAGNPANWASALNFVVAAIKRAQTVAVLLAPKYVNSALSQLALPNEPLAVIDPSPLIGLSGVGLPFEDLYAKLPDRLALEAAQLADHFNIENIDHLLDEDITSPAIPDVRALSPSVVRDAMEITTLRLRTHVQTVISDTGRAAESLEIAVRPGIGYVRMLNPPSCKRCVVLAGKFYRWNVGFERHPGCDCRHIPADESVAGDLRVDPDEYFHSLSAADQDLVFTKAGAQAIRDGADISQVVNADQGMRVAQVYGRNLKITDQGVTKRGQAGRAFKARGRNASTTPRLMPSSIYQIADDRADAIRLLRMNGYLTDETPLARRSAAGSQRVDVPKALPDRESAPVPVPAGGSTDGPPPIKPPTPAAAAAGEPEGWSGHIKGYQHPHHTPTWTEDERVQRQNALGVVPAGEQLHQHEIETAEKLQAIGERLTWIRRGEPDTDGRRLPTNDFVWHTRDNVEVDTKSTTARYATIAGHIKGSVLRARDAGVVKDHFLIDIGEKALSEKLRRQLSRYNASGSPDRRIKGLWVLSAGVLIKVALDL